MSNSLTPTLPINPTLQELTIFLPDLLIPLNELALVLNQLPDLARLCLVNALKITSAATLSSPEITLPSLTALTLNDIDLLSVIQFLNSVQTPPTTRLSVFTSSDPDPAFGTLDQLLQAYSTRSPFSRDITTLWINEEHMSTHLKFGLAMTSPDPHDNHEYDASLKVYEEDAPVLIAVISRVFDLNTLVELTVSSNSDRVSDNSWRELFGRMPQLRTLKVSRLSAYSFGQHMGIEGARAGLSDQLDGAASGAQTSGDDGHANGLSQEARLDRLGFDYRNLRELEMVFHDGDTSLFQDHLFRERDFVVDLVLRAKHGIGLTKFTCSGWPMAAGSLEQIAAVVPYSKVWLNGTETRYL